jgi:hypothetical protein
MGAVPSNTVFIAASRPDEVSFDDPRSGGLATVAWRDCLLGKAADLDGSGAITVDETTQCAQIGLDERLQGQPDILGQKMTIGGNRQFVIGAPGTSVSEAQLTEQRLAAVRAQEEQELEKQLEKQREKEKERQRVAAQQAVELARAEALAQEKERERVAAEQAAAQALAAAEAQAQAEKDRLVAQALAQAQERQRVAAQQALELAKAKEEAKEKVEQERLEAAMQAQAEARARLEAEQAAAAAKAKAEAERVRLAAEALAQEKERERVAAERVAAQAEKQRLVAQALAKEQQAQQQAQQQEQQQEQERLEAALQATTQGTAAPPPTNSNVTTLASVDDGAISMQPALPLPATTQAKPAALLVEMFQQRDATRVLSVEANQKILKIDKDPLELTIKSPTDGYLYVALAGSDQESLYLLFPNQIDANNQIKANAPVKLPRRSWRIVAGGPKGTDTVLVIVTDSPRDLSQLDGEDAGPFVMPLQTREGRSQLQALIGASGNADQQVCQTGGKTRNLEVQIVCSDAYAAKLIEFEER